MFAPSQAEPAPWLDELNQQQRAAVVHGAGPLLVIAGAGSGKTRTLACRVARLIDDGTNPERILLLTFTRRAAAEMLRRAVALTADRAAGRVWGGTFHSTANRLLRHYGNAVGLSDGFTVIDQGDTESLFGIIRTDLGMAEGKTRFPRKETIAAVYSRTVNAQTKLTQTLDERFPWCRDHTDDIKVMFQEYLRRKRSHNVVDYDDLLLYWRALLQSQAGDLVRGLFDHVLVDEYQDTNRVQADILSALCGPTGNLTVVGDDAQAIYSFRAASVDNILGFPDEYPDTTVVTLEQNYRSTPQILGAANAVIAQAAELFPKHLWSDRPVGARPKLVTCMDDQAQAEYVCDRILELREQGITLRDQAVLFRTGHHSDGLELELSRRHIPYVKFGGLKFLEAAHVKDLMGALRILDNPKDELAWHRVLQAIPGVGPATARKLFEHATERGAAADGDTVGALITGDFPLPPEARQPFARLQAGLSAARGEGGGEPPPAQQIDALLEFCRLVFARNYDDAAARVGDIEQLASLAAEYPTRSRFLTELTLDPPNSTSEFAGPPHLDDDYLTLSTIHSAKGGEWRAVYVIHAADGNIPSDMSLGEPGGLEEERRLLYVALTRAKDRLEVTVPQRFYHRAFNGSPNHSYALPSRFLTAAAHHFDSAAAGVPDEAESVGLAGDAPDPVAPLLAALWD
jgi:DNA helicase-2/ATP-dependent DNA helicase PcrA